jgi:Pumilio-family RNA binding repeat
MLSSEREGVAEAILSEVQPYLGDLMTDPFGNYLFQKLLDHVPPATRADIISSVAHRLVPSGVSLHGTRSVQKVVEVARTRAERDTVVAALSSAAVELATSANGNHIMQRVLEHFSKPASDDPPVDSSSTSSPHSNNSHSSSAAGAAGATAGTTASASSGCESDSAFVYKSLQVACFEVATHRHGCCVVQRALGAASPAQRAGLIAEVGRHALALMQDPFGNYVCQYFCDHCTPEEVVPIVQAPLGQVVHLSMQKFRYVPHYYYYCLPDSIHLVTSAACAFKSLCVLL